MKKNYSKQNSAGEFSLWLNDIRRALISNGEMNVACGDCTACCTSSYFIHISSSEKETLGRIPEELQFEAIGSRKGDVLLGYTDDGSCPMYRNGKCEIYEHRPQTCRKFDCRIFNAAGLSENEDRSLINTRIGQWEFEFEDELSEKKMDAVKLAASFLEKYESFFPENWVPSNAIQKAIVAIQIFELFLGEQESAFETSDNESIRSRISEVMATLEQFQKRDSW